MLMRARSDVLAKIAADTEVAVSERRRRGSPGTARATPLARGAGWTVSDVVCTCGPSDRVYEEEHTGQSIGVVLSGSFQYRARDGRHLMTPGSVLLGNPGESYECDHEHAVGDRCVAFHFSPEYLEHIAAGLSSTVKPRFRATRLPPHRALSGAVARIALTLAHASDASWNELAVDVAANVLSLEPRGASRRCPPTRRVAGRITDQIRTIEADPVADATLDSLAAEAGQTPFTYLRTFEQLTGVTPHQFVLRARLRRAAVRLASEPAKVIEIALSSGFGDVSNFNKAFRGEFGVTPTAYRDRQRRVAV